jgi:Icc-related predicted phosphoesterase
VDIHKSENALKFAQKFIDAHKPDLLLIAGDITTFGPLEFAEEFLSGLIKLPGLPDGRIMVLPGNCDPREILSVIDRSKAVNLHQESETIDGITFVGLGGSNTTPFGTPFELSEDEIFSKLDSVMEPGVVLVLHFPVFGHLDEVPIGVHTGSKAAMQIVEKYRPSLVISGHIHETRGTDIDDYGTQYVNPGTLQGGYAALINIEQSEAEEDDKSLMKLECKIQLLDIKD